VGVETARAILGVDADAIQARLEGGRLRWGWDISARRRRGRPGRRGAVRELRLWARELIAPDLCDTLRLREVIPMILGRRRRRWPSVEVAHLLLCSRPAMLRLAASGQLPGRLRHGTRWFTRARLAAFLSRRLLRPHRRLEARGCRLEAAGRSQKARGQAGGWRPGDA
jgi:hypothetical protein